MAATSIDDNDKNDNNDGGLDDGDDSKMLLVSCDEVPQKFEIKKEYAKMSNLVKSICDADATVTEFTVKKVTADILKPIVDYLNKHEGKQPAEIAKPIRSVKMERIVDNVWDANFIDGMTKKQIFQIILAANYMDLPSLLHLGCAKIATLIKGKSPEEIKNILADDSDNGNVSNDANPSQQEQKTDN